MNSTAKFSFMEEWKKIKLGNLISYISKGIIPVYTSDKSSAVLVLNQRCNRDYKIDISAARFHDGNLKAILDNKMLRIGDILINSTGTGTAGRVAQIDTLRRPTTVDGHMIILRGNDKIVPKYLGYAIKQNQTLIEGLAEGSTGQTEINKIRLLDEVLISYPENKKQQEQISSILSNIDDKIELNRRINDNLEQQAENLYDKLFHNELFSELVNLGDVIQTTSGGTPLRSNPHFYEGGTLNWVKSKELNGTFIINTEELITDIAVNKSAAKILPENSVLIAMYGATVGEYAVISKQMTCNQAVCALQPNNNYPYPYLFMFAKRKKEELINKAIGSAQQNISQILVKQLLVSKNVELIKKYDLIVRPFFEKIKKNVIENEDLSQIRDSLLPKLMSGELKINDLHR